jgi:hypothetical protein
MDYTNLSLAESQAQDERRANDLRAVDVVSEGVRDGISA